MKVKYIFLFALSLLILACKREDDENQTVQYREKMRSFVIELSQYAKSLKPGFLVIPQNGIELVTSDGLANGIIAEKYLEAIDGNGQEELLYGFDNQDNTATPEEVSEHWRQLLEVAQAHGKKILVTDYCSASSNMTDSYHRNFSYGFVSFATSQRDLDIIPSFPIPIWHENDSSVFSLKQVRNFLYLINTVNYSNREDFIQAITGTNYDLIIMDLFSQDGSLFSGSDLDRLKSKANGGKRLVICYLSIGEAEDYRYYWQNSWNTAKPDWLGVENPDWEGNYQVKYWATEWQQIIFGNDNSYLKKILDAGYDGVYLDMIDAYEYFE